MTDIASSATGSVARSTLANELTTMLGADRVSTADAELDAYAHDSWPVSIVARRRGQHPTRPEVVVRVRDEQGVQAALEVARRREVPIVARGLGSSVTGQPLPTHGGIVMDLTDLTGEPQLDLENRVVTAGAGTRGGALETWLNERALTLNHFPQSLYRSSIGGWLATRATGQFSSKYGGIEQLVVRYRVVLADGSIIDVESRPRAAVGPDLRQLFLGSEGTLGIVVQVSLKVFEITALQTVAFTLPDVASGILAMKTLTQRGVRPALVRFYDELETRHAAPETPEGSCVMFLGCDGVPQIAEAELAVVRAMVTIAGGQDIGSAPVNAWLDRRWDFSTVERYLDAPGGYAETIEVAHWWSDIDTLYQALRTRLAPLADEVLAHFSHVYDQGVSLYIILLGHAVDDTDAARRLDGIWDTAMATTVEFGGALSHHHGAGLARQKYVAASLGSQHRLLATLKQAFDPTRTLNPGKLGL